MHAWNYLPFGSCELDVQLKIWFRLTSAIPWCETCLICLNFSLSLSTIWLCKHSNVNYLCGISTVRVARIPCTRDYERSINVFIMCVSHGNRSNTFAPQPQMQQLLHIQWKCNTAATPNTQQARNRAHAQMSGVQSMRSKWYITHVIWRVCCVMPNQATKAALCARKFVTQPPEHNKTHLHTIMTSLARFRHSLIGGVWV